MSEKDYARTRAISAPARDPDTRRGRTRDRSASLNTSDRPSWRSAVDRALDSPGEAVDSETHQAMKRHFAWDFSSVRLHTDEHAAESAADMQALAYTVGRHVVFGKGHYAPRTPRGRHLLAHELAHVAQQRQAREVTPADVLELGPAEDAWERDARTSAAGGETPAPAERIPTVPRARVQRSVIGSFFSDLLSLSPGPFKAIARAFGSENYNDQDLQKYLNLLKTTGKIEDRYDSDNKARAVVARWKQGKAGFAPDPQIRILLIREMATGHVSRADEQGVLTILQSSSHAELEQIVGNGGVDLKELDSKFSGDNAKALHAFFAAQFEGGVKAIRSGRVEFTQHVNTPYDWANVKSVLDQRAKRVENAVAAVPAIAKKPGASEDEEAERRKTFREQLREAGREEGASDADELSAELSSISTDERSRLIRDIATERTRLHTMSLGLKYQEGMDEDVKERRLATLQGTIAMLDLIAEVASSKLALEAPADQAQFEAMTTPLSAADKTAAQKAVKPFTREGVAKELGPAPPAAPAHGPGPHAPAPPAADADKFIPGALPGEHQTYEQQIASRVPVLIDEKYQKVAVGRGEAEHSDPNKTHTLGEMESIAEASQKETDAVFHAFIPGGQGTPLKADKFDATGTLISPGKIHDAWQSEQSKLQHRAGYKAESAQFWMFYLMQNDKKEDVGIEAINFRHNASPEFDDDNNPKNPEAVIESHVAVPLIHTNQQRLDEIGRGWDAFNTGRGNISLQLFKKNTPEKDRRFLWDQFAVLIHEYLHSLASKPYNDYADHLGGESTTEGNTLIEGVDSLLTETVWTHAKPRASLPEVRKKVEPEAFNKGEPFDASLLPDVTHRRYATYPNAVRLVSVVGTRNLYAAYFYGDVKLIGGPAH